MNKQELIDKINKEIEETKINTNWKESIKNKEKGKKLGLIFGRALAENLDEPEKPVVPQFVADWIEWCRKHNWTLTDVLNPEIASFHFSESVSKWLRETSMKVEHINESIIARAWLFGYTIEPPETLQVIIKKYDSTVYETEIPEDEAMKLIEGWSK